jgi:hypothetical protein
MSDVKPVNNVAEALTEAFNDVGGELYYIGELADLLYEQADSSDLTPHRIESICLSIRRMAESVSQQLEKSVDDAREASHALLPDGAAGRSQEQ